MLSLSSLRISNPLGNIRVRQVAILYGSTIASLAVGLLTSVLNTRYLSASEFGDYKFIQTFWSISILAITFGTFETLGNSATEDSKSSHFYGSCFLIALATSLLMAVSAYAFSFFVERSLSFDLASTIRYFVPFVFVFSLQALFVPLLRGENRIALLSLLNVGPQFGYVIVASAFIFSGIEFSLTLAISIYITTLGSTIFFIAYCIHPTIHFSKAHILQILSKNRIFGVHVYLASLANTGTSHLGNLALAYMHSTVLVGQYALASSITMPIALIPSTIGTVFYNSFAKSYKMPAKVLFFTYVISIASLIIFLLLLRSIILFLYTAKFEAIITASYICAVGNTFQGLGDFTNRFLLAHGQGRSLKRGAIFAGIGNILGFIVLAPFWGLNGAATSKVFAGLIYLMFMRHYYKQFTGSEIAPTN